MKLDLDTKASLHNEFDIVVRNVETNEKKEYKAYNIVLNRTLSRLADFSSNSSSAGYNISVGDGAGVLDATRESLFNHIDRKVWTHVDGEVNWETLEGWRRVKIVLQPAEHVGTEFSEVGLSEADNVRLMTHAFIEDSEGNPITLPPKQDNEEITFYATWYFKLLNNGVNGMQYLGTGEDPTSNDATVLIGILYNLGGDETDVSTTWRSFVSRFKLGTDTPPLIGSGSTIYNAVTRVSTVKSHSTTKDGYSRKMDDVQRHESDQSNFEIWSILIQVGTFSHACLLCVLPIEDLPASVWDGITVTDVEIGTGDGENVWFEVPWSFTEDDILKVDSATLTEGTDYTKFAGAYDDIYGYAQNFKFYPIIEMQSDGSLITSVSERNKIASGASNNSLDNTSLYGTHNDYFVFDFGETQRWGIGSFRWAMGSSLNSYQITKFSISYSEDNENWTLHEEVETGFTASNAGSWYEKEFNNPIESQFRYIKIHTIETDRANDETRIREIAFRVKTRTYKLNTAPNAGEAVTTTYTIKKYIPKDETRVLDISGPTVTFGAENP